MSRVTHVTLAYVAPREQIELTLFNPFKTKVTWQNKS